MCVRLQIMIAFEFNEAQIVHLTTLLYINQFKTTKGSSHVLFAAATCVLLVAKLNVGQVSGQN